MSTPEASPPPPKPEPKPRPPIPTKPTNGTSEAQPMERGSAARNAGKVKSIVNKFSHQETPSAAGSETNGSISGKRPKRAPTVKPKPRRSRALQSPDDQAPPLPMKKSQRRKKGEKENCETVMEGAGEEGSTTSDAVDGDRSAPDGGEVESHMIGRLNREVVQGVGQPPGPRCDKNCSCVCHLQRPGMKLVWVPITEGEEEAEEEEDQDNETEAREEVEEDKTTERGEERREVQQEEEKEVGEDDGEFSVSLSSGEEESEVPISSKAKFKYTLELKGDASRRRSDPGPQVVLTSYSSTHAPPVHLPKAHSMEVPEEESIYEAQLEVISLPKKLQLNRPPPIPIIQINKPLRRSTTPSTSSDTGTGAQVRTDMDTEELPPAIPPRVPLVKGKAPRPAPAPMPRGSSLPYPTLRPSSPLLPPPEHSPPVSPRLPHRAPPPPPTKSSINGQPLNNHCTQPAPAKDVDEEKVEKEEEQQPVAAPRRKSIDFEAQMEEEPLYQIYSETVITKEIRRQTVCRNISKTSIDFQMDPRRSGPVLGTGASRSSPIPLSAQNTLWRDLPCVRDSGVLDTLSPEQCKYQESMFEVLTSEVSYLRSLRVLTEHFLESRELQDTLIIRDKKTLFSNILRIREVSERFLKDLEERLEEGLVIPNICDIIHYHAQHNFPAYIDYVRNQIYQEKTYTSLMQCNTQFAAVITRLQESPKCQRLPFMSFLLLPFQRITRIKMLIENILKRSKEGTNEERTASKALDSVSKIIEECNTQVGKMKQMEELIEINKALEFDKLKAVPIISQNRYLEKRGELQEMAKGGTLFNLRPKFSPVFLFLFNDLLLITSKKSTERYVVLDHAHRSLVQVQSLREEHPNPSLENCFSLTLLENHQGRMMERLLKAPTQSDMHRWVAAFPNPNDPDKEMDEVIYEDWDCPQVQCVEKYIAQQADELNLEPTEIINVLRKTNEGWYEGMRLSDGQKGWFPVGNVLEITNEHVRRRNLRERYRVIQAATLLTKT